MKKRPANWPAPVNLERPFLFQIEAILAPEAVRLVTEAGHGGTIAVKIPLGLLDAPDNLRLAEFCGFYTLLLRDGHYLFNIHS